MEFTKEEKKAIETLEIEGTENNYLEVKILLNLVERQQKEIEEYKNVIRNSNKNWISKDKIREKIKELEITRNSSVTDNGFTIMSVVISNFKELLEEK